MNQKVFVNIDEIDSAVEQLKNLKESCKKNKSKKPPISSYDQGELHDEIQLLYDNINASWTIMEKLIDRTIQFLSGKSKSTSQSDKKSAKAVKK